MSNTRNEIEYPKFSVLMSIYIKETKENFIECMESILNQSVVPDEIVLVIDGPILDELRTVIYRYKNDYYELINIVENSQNKGLGLSLADGVPVCKYELIARMDTDDIAREDRFEKQLRLFLEDADLDICGSHIIEFDGIVQNEISRRLVPTTHDDIAKYQRRRSAFNHMTVMYKKATVLKAGNYEDCPLMEDDMLWVRMLLSGARCSNIDDYLVFARTGKAMIERRGGWEYFKKYRRGRKRIYSLGYISYWDYIYTLLVQLVVAMIPGSVRKLVFTKLLR